MRSGPFPFRILLVDDDPELAGLYAELLAARGYDVHVAHGGFEALADLRQSLPDVVMSDLEMRGMSGMELLAVLRQRFPTLPLIAISGGDGLEMEVLEADAALRRQSDGEQQIFEAIAHLARHGVRQRSVHPAARPWVPRWASRFTCSECLRSFRLSCNGDADAPGPHTCVCVYCGTPHNYVVGDEAA
ncbi:MAG: response regulator [Terriglobales bacterium]